MLHFPNYLYTDALKLFVVELFAMVRVKAVEIEKSEDTKENKYARRKELTYSANLALSLSYEYNDIINGRKSMDDIDPTVLNSVLDNLADIKRTTNSMEELIEVMNNRMTEAEKIVGI